MSKNAAISIAAVVGAIIVIVAVALLVVRPWESSQPAAEGDVQLLDESTHVLDDAGGGPRGAAGHREPPSRKARMRW